MVAAVNHRSQSPSHACFSLALVLATLTCEPLEAGGKSERMVILTECGT